MELMDEYEKQLGVRPGQGYGITETSPVIAGNIPMGRRITGKEPLPKDASLGYPIPGFGIKVLNIDTGEPCKPGEKGMLYVHGICVMKGYYEDPEQTAEVLDSEGWYKTGDMVTPPPRDKMLPPSLYAALARCHSDNCTSSARL